jgi:threonylcarbamoyladenosine tRNA methylthiotransferase MtaB
VPTYHIENFGCRASQADGDAIARQLADVGLTSAPSADVVVVNTCSVTEEAERAARAYIRRARRRQPNARIVVTGCYAQRAPDEVAALAGVDAVVGNSHKGQVAALASSPDFIPVSALAPVLADDFAHIEWARLPISGLVAGAGRTRPVLKVQDGCGNRCSFCIIPTTRGPSRSVSLAECLDSAREFAGSGGQELVLSGINLGRWGRDLFPALALETLVSALLEQTALPRLRLSSVEPMDWTPELLRLFSAYGRGLHPRLAPHFHVPLQSGSDTILRRMYRRYRPWHYAEKLAHMRAIAPDAAIGADVMVGFPGETDELFEQSYDFIAAQPLTYLHLFPFSARPGTPAASLASVPAAAVRERMDALRALIAGKAAAFRERFSGQTRSAVTLVGGRGLTDNFLEVRLPPSDSAGGDAGAPPANRLITLRIESLGAGPGAELSGAVLAGQW